MEQQDIINAIKARKNLRTDRALAKFLGISQNGAIARMKIGKGGKQVHSLLGLILDLIPQGKSTI